MQALAHLPYYPCTHLSSPDTFLYPLYAPATPLHPLRSPYALPYGWRRRRSACMSALTLPFSPLLPPPPPLPFPIAAPQPPSLITPLCCSYPHPCPPSPPLASPVVAAPVQAPVPVPEAVQDQVGQATAGFVTIVILPRHVRRATLDDLTWTLLTLHDHVQYHVKCFKVNRLACHAWVAKIAFAVQLIDDSWISVYNLHRHHPPSNVSPLLMLHGHIWDIIDCSTASRSAFCCLACLGWSCVFNNAWSCPASGGKLDSEQTGFLLLGTLWSDVAFTLLVLHDQCLGPCHMMIT